MTKSSLRVTGAPCRYAGTYFDMSARATTNATETSIKIIYKCDFGWLAVLDTVSVVVLLAGVSSLVLKRKILDPDFFGHVTITT